MKRPIRILELRSVWGTGGGPDKTILLGAAKADPAHAAVTVCYLRHTEDPAYGLHERACQLGVDYVEIRERHALDAAAWRALKQLVLARGINIVHSHDYKTNLLALLLARVTPAVAMSTAHNWSGASWKERLIYYPADKRLARFFRAIIAVSPEVRGELLRRGAPASRVTTMANGIDHEEYRRRPDREAEIRCALGLSRRDIVIGSVGRLGPEKRFDLLLSAFAEAAHAVPALRLVIAGEGDQRQALGRRAASLGISNSVALLGHRTDIVDLHHAFDLYVQSSDIEGSPNAVLEAMAMETPVIATDAGGTRELITHLVQGWIVPTGQPESLAQAIRTVVTDPASARARARQARLKVERELSFDVRTRRLEQLYADLVEGRTPARVAPSALVSHRT